MVTSRIGLPVLGLFFVILLAGFAYAESGSGSSGGAKGSSGGMSEKRGTHQEQQKPKDTPEQAGSQGQQGMKGSGSPMEHDKGGDKMIDDKGKTKGKK
jgi:hypothetical protein